MLRFLLSVEEKELGDSVADMIACSTDDLLQTPSSNATPACSENLQRFNEVLYPLSSYEALSNLARSGS